MFFIHALACVCIITTYVTIVHGTTSTSVLATKPRFNMKLRNALMLNSIPGISFEECLKECIAREKCRSISYKRTAHHCYLGTEDAITNSSNLVTSQGYIYSDRTNWNMTADVGCTNCLMTETCSKNGSISKCEVKECGVASEKQDTTKFGNMMAVGSVVMHVCSENSRSTVFSTCLENGQWSSINDFICEIDLPQLEGKKFHITHNSTNKWWHMDPSKNWIITTKWSQGSNSDLYTEFSFVKLPNVKDKFNIRMNSPEIFVVVRDSSLFVESNGQEADTFTISPAGNMFRIFHEESQSYVYVDNNKFVTTYGSPAHDRTVFRFEPL